MGKGKRNREHKRKDKHARDVKTQPEMKRSDKKTKRKADLNLPPPAGETSNGDLKDAKSRKLDLPPPQETDGTPIEGEGSTIATELESVNNNANPIQVSINNPEIAKLEPRRPRTRSSPHESPLAKAV